MRIYELARPVALALILWALLPTSLLAAKNPPSRGAEAGYVPALAAADHFLHAWQSGDIESGMVLLSSHAKQSARSEDVEKFFSNSNPSAYEIGHGKLLKRGRYEFPIVLISSTSKVQVRRRFLSIVIVDTGSNDWAVDKLP